jgi:DAK2 domain fusion protein YloV
VVDSGGQGLFVILEGMLRHMQGLPVTDTIPHAANLAHLPLDAHFEEEGELQFDDAYPYDVQFVILGEGMDVARVRVGIEAMGDCPLTVGDADAIKVHVHVVDPGVPISFGAKFGSIGDVVVEDMRAQYEVYAASRSCQPALEMPAPVTLLGEREPPAISVVVVTAGDGLSNVFRSLGATAIVEGGQTMNPSTAQILNAIESAQSDEVIVLPNNKNILMAAAQAAEVSHKHVIVVPTRTIPQGISAMLALDQSASLQDNAASMEVSSHEVITGEVTWATRNVQLNGIQVNEGDAIGLLEDELVVDTRSFGEAVRWLLAEAKLDDCELVTLYYGEQVTGEDAMSLVDRLAEAYPDLEFEVIEGGQPHYPYILSIE